MDDYTFFLVQQLDDQIRRTALLIEQYQLHVTGLLPSRRDCEEIELKETRAEHARLLTYRTSLTAELFYDVMN